MHEKFWWIIYSVFHPKMVAFVGYFYLLFSFIRVSAVRFLFSKNYEKKLHSNTKYIYFNCSTHVLKISFTEQLGKLALFRSNIVHKLCHSARICFATSFKYPHKEKSHGFESGELGTHGMVPLPLTVSCDTLLLEPRIPFEVWTIS